MPAVVVACSGSEGPASPASDVTAGAGGSAAAGSVGSGGTSASGGTGANDGASASGGTGASAANSGGGELGTGGTGQGGSGPGTGEGLQIGGMCFPACGFPEVTDPDGDGYGWEALQSCVDPSSALASNAAACTPPPAPVAPTPGEGGLYTGDVCHPICSSVITDPDENGETDGWGYERQMACVIAGSAAALGGVPCNPMLPPLVPGDGILIDDVCNPLCVDPVESDPDQDGFGYENDTTCVVSTSVAALQGIPCDAPDPPDPPEPPPPPPGEGWNADYTATMFGEADCEPLGFDDPGNTNLNFSTCAATGAVQLNGENQRWFGATGDLATLWNGPECVCGGGQTQGVCDGPPACPGQTNCGVCVEVACNASGTHSYQNDGFTHNEFCKPGVSVVVELIDACPHNHPNNTYWCTAERPNHVDISCSAFAELTQGRAIGEIGSINVYAREVDCSVGLGVKTF